jgi:hypothetical protein
MFEFQNKALPSCNVFLLGSGGHRQQNLGLYLPHPYFPAGDIGWMIQSPFIHSSIANTLMRKTQL